MRDQNYNKFHCYKAVVVVMKLMSFLEVWCRNEASNFAKVLKFEYLQNLSKSTDFKVCLIVKFYVFLCFLCSYLSSLVM